MIHEASCTILIDPPKFGKALNIMGVGAEPPIPTDAEMEEVFPDWKTKGKIFIARAVSEENKEGRDVLTQQDLFRYGMKFVICEAKKLA
jgi:hypothetical protein